MLKKTKVSKETYRLEQSGARKIIPPEYFKETVFAREELPWKFKEITFFIHKLDDEDVAVVALQIEWKELDICALFMCFPGR
jgi:hypothetical protein